MPGNRARSPGICSVTLQVSHVVRMIVFPKLASLLTSMGMGQVHHPRRSRTFPQSSWRRFVTTQLLSHLLSLVWSCACISCPCTPHTTVSPVVHNVCADWLACPLNPTTLSHLGARPRARIPHGLFSSLFTGLMGTLTKKGKWFEETEWRKRRGKSRE